MGLVSLVKHAHTGELLAWKEMDKRLIEERHAQKYVDKERDTMIKLHHPFIIKMKGIIESKSKLAFLTEFCSGGELYALLTQHNSFDMKATQ